MSVNEETIVTVPYQLLQQCRGLSIDIGASLIKLVFRSKEDQNPDSNGSFPQVGRLHIVSFPRINIDEALNYVIAHADISRINDEPPTIYGTGVGCTEFGKIINDTLNISLCQKFELDCHVRGFLYLTSHLSRHQLLEPFLDDAAEEPIAYIKSQMKGYGKLQELKVTRTVNFDEQHLLKLIPERIGRPSKDALDAAAAGIPLAAAESDFFPCMLTMCGSALGTIKVESNKDFKFIDLSNRCGRSFLGLSSLLFGSKTFDELMELAAKGTARNLDQYSDDIVMPANAAQDNKDSYSALVDDMKSAPALLFNFGKAASAGTDNFRQEDVARALLNYIISDIVHCTENACIRHGVKRLFYCGSFCSHPLVRRLITTEHIRRNLIQMMLCQCQSESVQFDFIKPGSHLAAIGCCLDDVD